MHFYRMYRYKKANVVNMYPHMLAAINIEYMELPLLNLIRLPSAYSNVYIYKYYIIWISEPWPIINTAFVIILRYLSLNFLDH